MTIDSVVQKTGITLGVVVLFATVTWFLTSPIIGRGDPRHPLPLLDGGRAGRLRPRDGQLLQEGRLAGAGVIALRLLQSLFVGAFSKVIGGSSPAVRAAS